MPTYRVTEVQTVEYVWTVEADTYQAAQELADDGHVPADAKSDITDSYREVDEQV